MWCYSYSPWKKIITDEILHDDPDIICLQEVDRLSDHDPILTKSGYDFSNMIGGYEAEGKQDGLLIGWKTHRFERIIKLNEETFRNRIGLSRLTRKIGLICASRSKRSHQSNSIINWFTERSRQIGFLSRGIQTYQEFINTSSSSSSSANWISSLAGDFNDQPNSSGYRFLTGIGLDSEQRKIFDQSNLTHKSVDQVMNRDIDEARYETIEGGDDQVFKDVRKPTESDGSFNEDELKETYRSIPWISLYGRWIDQMNGQDGNRFKDREDKIAKSNSNDSREERILRGSFEPILLIFILDDRSEIERNQSSNPKFKVMSLLPTHRTQDLLPRPPRLKIEPSDHIPLMVEIMI
ncbi:hypothetical protein DFH28DRAFT_1081998 [Melampsora americana]|nr:hypothetical protein DFH28DRAFT_1081998 [Melampsora americana]